MRARFSIEALPLETLHEFRISRVGSKTYENLVFVAEVGDLVARGESAPREFYGEDLPKAREALAHFLEEAEDFPDLAERIVEAPDAKAADRAIGDALARYDAVGRDPAGRTALDGCLYDLAGKALGVPLYRMLSLDPAKIGRAHV